MKSPPETAIALTPARGGSKGVPRKNLADLGGRPLIAWTIAAARDCPHISRICVSTDDAEIADTARAWGADVPFLRPADLSGDEAPMLAVARHFVDTLELSDEQIVALLQPTSPFRTAEDLSAAIDLFISSGASALVSVVRSESHPHWTFRMMDRGRVAPFIAGQEKPTRRQDLEPAYRPNGAIYLCRAGAIRCNDGWSGPDTVGYEMPRERSLDIDDPWDLDIARALIGANNVGRS